jgi:hypothetical protein
MFAGIGKAIVVAASITISSIYRGWVLSLLWAWFMVTQFDLPHLALAGAIGLFVTISFLTHSPDQSEVKSPMKEIGGAVVTSLMWSTLSLIMGWIVYQFM